jgi:hypothetical protein
LKDDRAARKAWTVPIAGAVAPTIAGRADLLVEMGFTQITVGMFAAILASQGSMAAQPRPHIVHNVGAGDDLPVACHDDDLFCSR